VPRKNKAERKAKAAYKKNIHIIALNINSGKNREKSIESLERIVTNAEKDILTVDSWRDAEEDDVQRNVVALTCGDDIEEEESGVLSSGPTEECMAKELDIMIVVDISKSISEQEIIEERQCVHYILANFDLDPLKTRLGLVTYHKYFNVEFELDQYPFTREEALATGVLKRPNKVAGTKTAMSLNVTMDLFRKDKENNPFLNPFRQQVIILITDGKATSERDDMRAMAKVVEKSGTKLVSVGVGSGIDERELRLLATGTRDENVVIIARDFREMRRVNELIANAACEP